VRDDVRQVATSPMGQLSFAHDELVEESEQAAVRRFAGRLYQPVMRRLGWAPRRGREEAGDTAMLRASVISFMAHTVRDARTRREAARRAHAYLGYGRRGDGELHPDAVDANLVGTSLAIAVQDGDAAFFDHLLERAVGTDDALVRGHMFRALGATRDPELAARARSLSLDPRLRLNEMRQPIGRQSRMPETRDATWEFTKENIDAIVERIGSDRAGYMPWSGSDFCSEEGAQNVQAFFGDRVSAWPGGPRNLALVLERVRLCAARVQRHQESAREFF
jgi:alanyl aminopeptidase